MILFKCTCSYTWIVGKKKVYGPLESDPRNGPATIVPSYARIVDRETWEDSESDCFDRFLKMQNASQLPKPGDAEWAKGFIASSHPA